MLQKLSFLLDHEEENLKLKSRLKGHNNASHSFKEGFDFLQLIKNWKEIAGDKVAEYTIPLKNQNGTLIILSNHAAFAQQLSFMEVPLKKKIFALYPHLEKSIKSLKFIVDSTHFEEQKKMTTKALGSEKKEVPTLHPYSPEYRQLKKEATLLFAEFDEELREQFISLYIQVESKKYLP